MPGVDVGAVEIALLVVDKGHFLLGRKIAHRDTIVADGVVVAKIEGDVGVLGYQAFRGDSELERGDGELATAVAVEHEAGRVLAGSRNELGTVHHEAAVVVDIGHDVANDKVALVAAEARIAVFLRFEAGGHGFLDAPRNGLAEVVCMREANAVGCEFGELDLGAVGSEVGIAGFGTEACARPVEPSSLAVPDAVLVVVIALRTMQHVPVFGRCVMELGGIVEPSAYAPSLDAEPEGCLALEAPLRGTRPVEHTVAQQQLAPCDKVNDILRLGVLLAECLHRRHPSIEVAAARGRCGIGRQHTGEVHQLGVGFHLDLDGIGVKVGHTALHGGIQGAVAGAEGIHRLAVGFLLLLVGGALVGKGQQFGRQALGGELHPDGFLRRHGCTEKQGADDGDILFHGITSYVQTKGQPTEAFSFSAFSASWRASMQSSMSPSMKAGRLCMLQPMRWSVTRDCG